MRMPRTPARLGLAIVTFVATLGSGLVVQQPAHAANAKPQTIPALQEWTGGAGSYTVSAATRIVRNTTDATTLATTSQVFADDLKSLTGSTIAQTTGTTADLAAGDIFLSLGSTDTALGTEGYALNVTDKITITARDDKGAFYGTRTVLQLLHQSTSIPQGTARDWSLKPERGLMVDDGRKFFTAQWLRDHVKELAYLKLNYFHLHLSDNLGFRIESTKHPEYVSADHLTKAEVTDLIALAARYKITVVPEFDAPGHMDPILAQHTDLKLVSISGTVNNGFIDLSKDAAYTLIKDIYDEYVPLFPGPYFHIGSDEYVSDYSSYPQLLTYARAHYGANATAKDTYYGFINWANGIVRAAGKTTRMWNDGIKSGDGTINPDTNIVIEFWYNYGLSPQQLVDRGHLVSNESWSPTYYVLGGSKPNTTWGYETWYPDLFQGNQTLSTATKSKNIGSKVHVWCDSPNAETESQVAGGIKDILRVVAQQTWGSPNNEWITVDLGTTRQIGRVKLTWEAAYGKGYQIQTSNDGTTWSSIYTTSTSDGGVDDLTGLTGSGRYVRMQGTLRATTYGFSLFEFEVYAASPVVSGATYNVTTSTKNMDVPGGSTSAGTQLIVWAPHTGANQKFVITDTGDGTYTIKNVNSGLCVDVNGGSAAAGAAITQWTCHGGPNQRWRITSASGGYALVSVGSGLSITAAGSTDGSKLTQQTDTGSALQRWSFTKV